MNDTLDRLRRRTYYRLFGADSVLRRVMPRAGSTLDIGCSDGRGSEQLTGAFGCDIHRPSLVAAVATGRRRAVVQADLRHLPYRSASVDLVTALDVIEHFEKRDALQVVAEIERVARRLAFVVTPSGFVPQPPTENEPWQEHRSGFEPDELEDLGFEVSGLGGWARLRAAYGAFRGGPLGQLLAVASQPITKGRPRASFHLVGLKRLGG